LSTFKTYSKGEAFSWAIYNFLPERLPVNEQKVEIFILLLNRVFSAGTASQ
jgi:hypothetical protein